MVTKRVVRATNERIITDVCVSFGHYLLGGGKLNSACLGRTIRRSFVGAGHGLDFAQRQFLVYGGG